ncbi:MAG: 23S rRNA (pseudouridine(1915)-N(3))-methyltransferase RlmH [Bacilli bacterium]|nr:23S rRNA (pseudouridine(1915)-N(3))-methyltransferase RlmH [Bacilli bacterium]
MIKIITVGTIKEKYLKEAIEEYLKRLKKYTNIELIEVKDEGLVEEQKAINLEGEKINKYLSSKDYIITLEIEGKSFTSEEFATKLNQIQIESSNIVFIIGGSYGLSDEIKSKAKLHLSFSKMTFPHQLFRVFLLEQIYRAYKIINNESYHK